MRISAEAFSLPKAGHQRSEYEDAFFPDRPIRGEGARFRFAVADGATEASFSGLWARQLTRAFVESPGEVDDLAELVTQVQPLWTAEVGQKELPWYAQAKTQSGAFSSLIGLSLCDTAEGGGSWNAIAVGDSCLVLVRDEEVIESFPLARSSDFGSAPFLLSSDLRLRDGISAHVTRRSGDCQSHDEFYLMTDALACWFLSEVEQGFKPWPSLRKLDHDEEFEGLVTEHRGARVLRNDDTTLLRIQVFF